VNAGIASLSLPYDALVFDLGGVIATHDNDALLARMAARCSAPGVADRITAVMRTTGIGSGREPVSALHARLCEECGMEADWTEFAGIWSSHLGLDPAMLDLVEGLAARRRVMLFSNTNAEHWDFLVALSGGRLARLEPYLSHELGLEKPAVEAFLAVASRAGIEPARSLFIDDVEANVEGARRAGFEGFRFTDQAGFEQYLRAAASR